MAVSNTDSERTFEEIKRLCHMDLDSGELRRRVVERLERVVPFEGYALNTADPLSGLPTHLLHRDLTSNEKDAQFFMEHIFFDDDVSEYGWMAKSGLAVVRLSEATDGKLERALRHREHNAPTMGFGYEVRSDFTAGRDLWGAMCLARERGRPDFDEREVELIRRIAPHLGAGLQAAALKAQAHEDLPEANEASGMLVLDGRSRVTQYTAAALRLLGELEELGANWRDWGGLPHAVWMVVGALRRSLKSQMERDLHSVPNLCARRAPGAGLRCRHP